jgi:hypothetical protein
MLKPFAHIADTDDPNTVAQKVEQLRRYFQDMLYTGYWSTFYGIVMGPI